jgi:NNP family nitrate/nitrite transporter-like MFS transporter
MGNISFFFPKSEKGNALALNAGLGNLGVSVVQFLVPIVITAGVFGWIGGDPQTATATDGAATQLWLQNAGFIWVPFIIASAFAAWFGMNDIASAKASFSEQSIIFQRKHNWIMCWLYTGTFGSFIGYSAAFPLLSKLVFPDVNALQYAFLGPLVGALSRSLTSWAWRLARSASSTSSESKTSQVRSGASSPASSSCSSSVASVTPPPSK